MTISSYGYPGSLDRIGWARVTEFAAGTEYNVESNTHFNAAAGPGGIDRSISVSAGGAAGRGVYDNSDSVEVLACDPALSGTRWDMLVLNRNFLTKTTTLEIVEGGSTAAIPTRLNSVTTGVDQQPLWLAKVVAGQTTIQGWRDLRVWHGPGGYVAKDPLVLDYHTRVGTEITIGNDVYTRIVDPQTNVASWLKTTNVLQPVRMFGAGAALTGSGSAPANAEFKMQAGSYVGSTDAAGFSRITFPTPFPNGLLSLSLLNGDDGAAKDITYSIGGSTAWGLGSKENVVYRVYGAVGGARQPLSGFNHRTNYIAIGW